MKLIPGHYYDITLPDGYLHTIGVISSEGDGWYKVGRWVRMFEPRPGACQILLGPEYSLNSSQLATVREKIPEEMMAKCKASGINVPTE